MLIIAQCTHSVSLYCKMVAQQATRSQSIWRRLVRLQVKDDSSTSRYEQVYKWFPASPTYSHLGTVSSSQYNTWKVPEHI